MKHRLRNVQCHVCRKERPLAHAHLLDGEVQVDGDDEAPQRVKIALCCNCFLRQGRPAPSEDEEANTFREIETDELIDELNRRFDVMVFGGFRWLYHPGLVRNMDYSDEFEFKTWRFGGPDFACQGLAHQLMGILNWRSLSDE